MNFLKRFIAAAVALVMVLALVPASALVANAADVTYVLEASAMEAFAAGAKADGEAEAAGTDNYFTLHWGSKTKLDSSSKTFEDGYKSGQRINWQSKTTVGSTPMYCVGFTTAGAAAVKVWWVSGGDGREVAIFDASGAVVANTVASESVKNSLYISELSLAEAGTYYLGSSAGSNYLFKVEVTVSEGHTHAYVAGETVAPSCTKEGYTVYSCECGASVNDDKVAALGHTMGEGVVTNASCTAQGYTTYTCEVCGATEKDDYVDATGHSYGEDGYCVCGRCEHAVDTTYTFVSTELTGADKEAVADGTKLGTNGFFTANVEAAEEGADPNMTKRYSSSKGVYAVELGKGGAGTISFVLTGTANVTVLAASTGGSNVSDLTLVNEYGSTVAEDNGATTVTGTGNVAFTYSNLTPGTYYVTNPGTARNTRVASVEVVETVNAGCEHNPIMVNFTMNAGFTAGTATVVAPVGTTYYQAYGIGGMELTINGGEPTLLPQVMGRQPVIFSITNDGEAAAEYTLAVSVPAGSMSNPEILEELNWTYLDVSLEENDRDGYYYQYTAPADGMVTLYLAYVPEGVQADITVFNNTTYAQKSLLADGVDNYGLELQLPVSEGDVLDIQVAVLPDASWNVPAAEFNLAGNFTYPAGTEKNPISIEWEWNEAWSEASATVTVPAGETLYFYGQSGMIMTVDGVETAVNEEGVFSLTNATEAEVSYELELVYPVGSFENPEVLTSIESFSGSTEKDSWSGYCFTYTPDFNGTISLSIASITEGVEGDIVVTNQVTYAQSSLAYEGVDGVLTVEVAKGEALVIQIMTLPDESWSNPAADITVAGTSEIILTPADIVDMAYELGKNEWLEGIQTLTGKIVAITEPYSSYKNVTVTIAVEGREDKPIICYRIVAGEGITEDDMAGLLIGDTITVTGYITNYNGSAIEFSTKDGVKGTLDAIEKTEEIPFTLNFVVPEGVAPIASVSGNQNMVTMPSAGAPEGYAFVGWVAENVAETEEMPENVIPGGTPYATEGEVTLYALYTWGDVSYSLYTGELVEGDYVIAYNDGTDDGALKAAMGSSNRLAYSTVTVVDGVVTDATTDLVWHIAPNGDYWTIYNSASGKYAAATTTNNKGALLSSVTDYAKWTVTGEDTYEFQNLGNGRYLRRNGTYGFAAYGSTTGGPLSLYKLSGTYYYSTLNAEEEVEKFNLAGANLELANDITMYFYVNAADVADGYYMEIVKTNADGSKVTKQVAKADWTPYGNMYYVGFNGMAAKEIADEIAVTVYNAEGTQVSNSIVTSISSYALRALDNAAYASMHTMMADLLNYGAAAQTFFKYNTDNLANANMTEAHQALATQGFDMSKYTNDAVAGAGAMGANLGLETNILQYFFFDPAVVDNTMTAKVSYTNFKGVKKTAEISGDKFGTLAGYGFVTVEVAILVPADVMSLVTVEIVDANGNVVASVSDSISSYAVRTNAASPNALYVELMEYCLSCEAFFG